MCLPSGRCRLSFVPEEEGEALTPALPCTGDDLEPGEDHDDDGDGEEDVRPVQDIQNAVFLSNDHGGKDGTTDDEAEADADEKYVADIMFHGPFLAG